MAAVDQTEGARGADSSQLAVPFGDGVRHLTHWRLEKRWGDIDAFVAQHLSDDMKAFQAMDQERAHRHLGDNIYERSCQVLKAEQDALRVRFHEEVTPYEVLERDGNILVTVGIQEMLDLLVGTAGVEYSNANAHLGVGDSSTAEDVSQTDLLAATNKLRKAMNATYPLTPSPKVTFQATFGSSEANFTWAEVGTFNAASGGDMLNRKVQALGTKSSGATWTLTEDITFT